MQEYKSAVDTVDYEEDDVFTADFVIFTQGFKVDLLLRELFKIYWIDFCDFFFRAVYQKNGNVANKNFVQNRIELNCISFKILNYKVCAKCVQSRFLQFSRKLGVLWLFSIETKMPITKFLFESFIYSIELNRIIFKILVFKIVLTNLSVLSWK